MKLILVTPNHKFDFTTALVVEGLKELGCVLHASDEGNGIQGHEVRSDDELILESKTADAVLFFFGKVRGNNPPKHYLVDRLFNKQNFAYVDGSEWTYTGHQEKNQAAQSLIDPSKRRGTNWINEEMLRKCNFYFKRECYPQDIERGLIPLPFGLMKGNFPSKIENKDIDVACVFGHTLTGLRREVMQACVELKQSTNCNVVVGGNLPPHEYASVLSRAKIVVDAWGGGDNCNRFYEAIGAKACCLYQRYNTIVPNGFVDMKHAVSYSSLEEFNELLKSLLKEPNKTRDIGTNGHEHALKHHSARTRAEFILKTVMENREVIS